MNERILEDDYPIFPGYLYVADGFVIQPDFSSTVLELKKSLAYKEIRNCDISARDLWDRAI